MRRSETQTRPPAGKRLPPIRLRLPIVAGSLALALALHANAQPPSFAWAKRIAGTINQNREFAVGLAIDGAANLYVTGWFDGTNDFGNGILLTNAPGGGQDMFIAKYNSAGTPLWARQGGASTDLWDAGRGIGVDSASHVYVTGQYHGYAAFDGWVLSGSTTEQFFLAKYDTDGGIQWVRQSVGAQSHYATALAVDSAGNSHAVGYIDDSATITFDEDTSLTNPSDAYGTFLVKYDNAGDAKWATLIGSNGQTYSTSAAVDESGNIYVSGAFQGALSIGNTHVSGAGIEDGYLAKFSRAGNLQWVRQMSTTSYGGDPGGVAGTDAFGNVYVAGGFGTSAGDTICFGPSTFGSPICLTNLGGGLPGLGIGDAFLVKYDGPTGTAQWAVRSGGADADFYYSVAADSEGNVCAAGAFGAFVTSTEGLSDASVRVAKYDSHGVEQWTVSSTGTNGAAALAPMVMDAAGNCFVAGWFQTNAVFGSSSLTGRGYFDFFLAKVGNEPLPLALEIQWNDPLPCLSVVGDVGARFVLEHAPTLPSVDWQPLLTNTLSTVPFNVCDETTEGVWTRFYRAIRVSDL